MNQRTDRMGVANNPEYLLSNFIYSIAVLVQGRTPNFIAANKRLRVTFS